MTKKSGNTKIMSGKTNVASEEKVAPVKLNVGAKKEMPQIKSLGVDESRTYLYETRTRDLVKEIWADGCVTHSEKLEMEANHDEIIRDFLVSTDLLEKMEKNPTIYSPEEIQAARFIVARLMRARELSLAKLQEIKYANYIRPQEMKVRQQRRQNKEHLDINFNLYQIFALNGSAHEVIEYARQEEKKRVMTPKDAEKTEKRIMNLINQVVENGHDVRYIRQFLENNQEQTL